MKKLLVLLMLLAMSLCIAVPAAGETGPNLLLNPSFEDDDDTDGVPDNWTLDAGGDGTPVYRTGDPANALEGDDYVELQVGSNDSWPNAWQGVQITAGNTHSIAVWLRTEHIDVGTKPCELKIEYYDTLIPGAWEDRIGEELTTVNVNESGQYEYHTFTGGAAPMAALSAKAVVVPVSSGDWSLYADAVHFGTGDPPNPYWPYGPQPCDGCFTHPNTDEVSWTNPEPRQPGDTITCDVWFDRTALGEPNNMTLIADDISNEFVTLSTIPGGLGGPIDLVPEKEYAWRVDCNDPNGSGPPILTEGPVWIFNTIDTPPTVEAGKKQAAWLSGGTVTVQLDATVTDDGLPDPPGQVSLKWDTLSGPDIPSFDNDTTEDPQVTFDTAGDYTLRLTADDTATAVPGSSDPDDTVLIKIYAEGYTALLAHWPFDAENLNDVIGGHHGTLVDAGGGGAAYVTGRNGAGKAIDLEGGDYVTIGDSGGGSSWADLTDEITVSAWVKHTGVDGDDVEKENQAIVSKGNSQWQISRAGWDGNNYFEAEGLSPITDAQGTNDIYDNKWHYLVATYNGEEIALYFDGRLDIPYTLATSGSINTSSFQVWIGANSEAVDREWGGLIDEVCIYEIGLPADKVLELFRAEGGANSCDEPPEFDVNGDCYIDLVDLALLASNHMQCNDVGGACQDDPENENY